MRAPGLVLLASLLTLAPIVAACGDDDAAPPDGPPPPQPVVVDRGWLRVTIEPEPARLVISVRLGDGSYEPRWQTTAGAGVDGDAPPLGFAGLRTATAEVTARVGSFRFIESGGPWTGVDRLADIVTTGGGATFSLWAGDARVGTAAVSFEDTETGIDPGIRGRPFHVRIHLELTDGNRASLAMPCGADEHFVGLGGQSWNVDHHGQTVPLWVQEDGIGKRDAPDDDYGGVWPLVGRRHSTHTPMPMMVSSAGYALAVATDRRAVFALCSEADDVARVEAWDRALDVQVFIGDSVAENIGLLSAWTGRPARPPLFAFAPWLDAIGGEANVRRVAGALRAAGIASSVIWTEDWRGGADEGDSYVLEENWRVDRDLYPDLEGVAAELHGAGFKFLTYHNTFVDTEADVFAEATSLGHVVTDGAGEPYLFTGVKLRDSTLLDLSNPAAVAWAKGVYGEGFGLGVDGWMADFGEWQPTDVVLASGEDALAVHNRYAVDWARLNRELFDAQAAADGVERLFFMRSAWLGSQPLVSVIWAGDQQTDWSLGDGLPSVIPMGIGLGVTGFPYFGSDIAGYMSMGAEPTTRELWFRWVTLGALSPIMRTHHGRSARLNWSWESDAASTAHFRRWTRFHMQLVPYLWSRAGEVERAGLPLLRPLFVDFGDEPWTWTITDEYLLGDRILVAPVLAEAATARSVTLPAGSWYPLFGGPAVAGGRTVEVAASVDDIPAFVPAGTLLELWPDGVDTVVDAPGAPDVVTSAELDGRREVWLWPGGDGVATESGVGFDVGRWTWQGRPADAALPATATFAGAPVPVTAGAGFVTVDVVGDGVLQWAGGGELTVAGGIADAPLTVRLYGP